jgi:hypothetical protein
MIKTFSHSFFSFTNVSFLTNTKIRSFHSTIYLLSDNDNNKFKELTEKFENLKTLTNIPEISKKTFTDPEELYKKFDELEKITKLNLEEKIQEIDSQRPGAPSDNINLKNNNQENLNTESTINNENLDEFGFHK